MHAEFDDAQRAASYIAEGVRHDFPEEELEVVWCDKRGLHTGNLTCQARGLAGELFKLCRQFPGASVDYTPDHPHGLLGTIVSAEHRYHNSAVSNHHHHQEAYSSKKDGRYVMVLLKTAQHGTLTKSGNDGSSFGQPTL